MTDVVVTDQAFGGVERERAVAQRHGCSFAEHQLSAADETEQAVNGARVVFTNFAPITESVLSTLGPSAVVIRYGIGVDNVDLAAARRLGVTVCNVPDYGAETVADHTVALLLAVLRRLDIYTQTVRRDGWIDPSRAGAIRSFSESTVGLIGTGRVGRGVALRLAPFGFRILAYDPFIDPAELGEIGIDAVELTELLAEADAVSVHAPLTEANRHLLDATRLAMLRPGAVVINTSRGPLIDQDALIGALLDGRLGGAGLDVFEEEPLRHGSPLRDLPNVLLTPHAAFYSDSSLANLQRLAAEEADRALSGKPPRCPIF